MKTTLVSTVIFITLFTLLPHAAAVDTTKWGLPDGAKARFGKGLLSEVTISPDGTRLAAASGAGIWIYNAETGEELSLLTEGMLLAGTTLITTSVAFSQDGEMLASGSADGSVRVWDMKTGFIFRTFYQHSSSVISVAFSQDGKMLASGSRDGGIRLYDIETGTVRSSGHGQFSDVNSVAFSPDAKTLASGGEDGTVRLWNLEKDAIQGTRILHRGVHHNIVYSVAFSPDGKVLASGSSSGGIDLWDARTGGHQHTFTGDHGSSHHVFSSAASVTFSPDGKTLATIPFFASNRILLWDVETRTLRHTFNAGNMSIGSAGHNLVFTADGKKLVSSGNGGIHLFDLETNSLRYSLTGYARRAQTTYRVAYSPDGKTIATSGYGIHLWNVETGVSKEMSTPFVYSIAFSPDGKTIASGTGRINSTGEISLYDVEKGTLRYTLQGHTDAIRSVAFSPDSKTLVSAGGSDRTVRVWDVEKGTIRGTFTEHTGSVSGVAFHPDGQTIASSSRETILIWNVETHFTHHSLTFNDNIQSVAFSPDGKILLGTTRHKTFLYSMETDETIERRLPDPVAAFSPDGKTLATGYIYSEGIQLWDVVDFSLLRTFSCVARDIAFSGDGKTLASVGSDEVVMLWDIKPEPIVHPEYIMQTHKLTDQGNFMHQQHRSFFSTVEMSPDGKTVAGMSTRRVSGTRSISVHTVCLWDLRTNLCRRTDIFRHGTRGGRNSFNLEFSPDGDILAYSEGFYLRLWDVVFGTPLHTLPISDQGRSNPLYRSGGVYIEFSPDGNTLAYSDGMGRNIFLYDVRTGTLRHTLTEPTNSSTGIKFSPDGTTIANYDTDNNIYLWNMKTGVIRPPLLWSKKATDSSSSIGFIHDFSPDGRMLLTVEDYHFYANSHLWDVEKGTLKRTFKSRITSVSPDWRTFVGSNHDTNGSPALYDLETGAFIRDVPGSYFLNEDTLISPVRGSPGIWDVNTLVLKQESSLSGVGFRDGVYNIDAQTFATIADDPSEIHIYKFIPEPDDPIMDTYGDSFVHIDAGYQRLPVINTVTSFDILTNGTNYPSNVAFSSDGSTLVSIENVVDRYSNIKESRILLWDVETRSLRRTITVPEHLGVLRSNFALSPDGKILAVRRNPSIEELHKGDLSIWNIETGIHQHTFTAPEAHVFAFSPDGKTLASGGWNIVQLWNVENRTLRHTLYPEVNERIIKVMFMPDGKTVVAQDGNGTTLLWDVRMGTLQQTHTDTLSSTKYAAIHPTGKTLISGSENGGFRIRHIQTGTIFGIEGAYNRILGDAYSIFHHFHSFSDPYSREVTSEAVRSYNENYMHKILGVAFSPNGKTVAFFGSAIHLWHAETGIPDPVLNKILSGHESDIASVAFSPDGSTLVSCDMSGAIYCWDLRFFNGVIGVNIRNRADVNGDGFVNLLDVQVVDSRMGMTGEDTSDDKGDADVNGDGIVNIADLALVTKFIGDVNGDSVVNLKDLDLVSKRLGETGKNTADINADGIVNIADLVIVAGNALSHTAAAAPSTYKQAAARLTVEQVQQWLNQARLLGETSPIYQRGILALEQLLTMLIPKQTSLLPNYPNPFNPETWIPYQLARPADVKISIYAVDGKLVRTLDLGHQPVGMYKNRSRAAHWDGRNALGESVASGIYFYEFTAGDFSATRKMLIRK